LIHRKNIYINSDKGQRQIFVHQQKQNEKMGDWGFFAWYNYAPIYQCLAPSGRSAGIYGLLKRKRCLCQGKFDFFLTRASLRDRIIDIFDHLINLSSHTPKMAEEVENGDLKKERIFKLSMQKHGIRLCDH